MAGATVNYMTAVIIEGLMGQHISPPIDIFRLLKSVGRGKLELFIIPIGNPDGYEYSWTTNRLWRKNRSHGGAGVDLNRNFDLQWGVSGSSSNPSSDVYSGPHASSEVETAAMESLFLKLADRIVLALDFHTFSQTILWPWSYDVSSVHPEEKMHQDTAEIFAPSGQSYTAMRSGKVYPSSGSASDFYARDGVISLTIELPPRYAGMLGFCPPPDAIVEAGADWAKKLSTWTATKFEEIPAEGGKMLHPRSEF